MSHREALALHYPELYHSLLLITGKEEETALQMFGQMDVNWPPLSKPTQIIKALGYVTWLVDDQI